MVNSPRYMVSSGGPGVNYKGEEVRASEQRSGEEKTRVGGQMERTMHGGLAKCCERTENVRSLAVALLGANTPNESVRAS